MGGRFEEGGIVGRGRDGGRRNGSLVGLKDEGR